LAISTENCQRNGNFVTNTASALEGSKLKSYCSGEEHDFFRHGRGERLYTPGNHGSPRRDHLGFAKRIHGAQNSAPWQTIENNQSLAKKHKSEHSELRKTI